MEQEQKEELVDQLSSLQQRSESEKSKRSSIKKEMACLVKQHKSEINRLQDEITHLKSSLIEPQKLQKLQKREKELESQVKSLKEDLTRKRELVISLKASQEKTEKEVVDKVAKIESRKEDIDRVQKLTKEVARKETMIKEFKTQYDDIKEKEAKAQKEIKTLNNKLKTLRNDLLRKETMVKETKEKLEAEIKEIKDTEAKSIDIGKHKEILRKYKQDCERKEMKISSLESKLETNASEIEKLKNESIIESKQTKNEVKKESKKADSVSKKLRKMEEASQNGVLVIRRMIKEMILSVEKLRSDVIISKHEMSSNCQEEFKHNDTTSMQTPVRDNKPLNMHQKSAQNDENAITNMYKESLDILGVSLGELEEFVQPVRSPSVQDKLPIFECYETSYVSSSKNTVGPGLNFEDLGVVQKDNKDLEVFTKVLNAIVDDPERLLTESEDIVQIFKKLLKEIKSLETSLGIYKFNGGQSKVVVQKQNEIKDTGRSSLDQYLEASNEYMKNMQN